MLQCRWCKASSVNCWAVWKSHIPCKVWGITHANKNHPTVYGVLEGYLESGWSLSRGKWYARTGLCFCGWFIVLPTTMRALHWNMDLFFPLANATSYLQVLDQVVICCVKRTYWRLSSAFLVVKNRLGCSRRRSNKMKHLQWGIYMTWESMMQ